MRTNIFCIAFITTLFLSNFALLKSAEAQQPNRAETQYPIVLVHGLMGFDNILGIDYFYQIPQLLTQHGAQVYTVSVSPANSTDLRGEQLLPQVLAVLAHTGADKVNLIGHSHGAPTARYVAGVRPDLVASVTSVGGVNWGSQFADVLRGHVQRGSWIEWLIDQGFIALANVIAGLSGGNGLPNDMLAATDSLTTQGSIAFNQNFPAGIPSRYCGHTPALASNGVHYFSWSGNRPMTHFLDPSDYALKLTSLAFNEANDGLVSICSSHLGQVINDSYRMNHLDQINHFFGLTSYGQSNPKNVYLAHAERLKNLGL